MLYMQELIKCPLKVRKEGRGPLPAGEGTGLREMSDPPEPVSDRGGDVPGARLPFVGPLPVTCWGIFLAVHHLNRCMPLLDCLSGSLRHIHVISSQPENASFVLKNACLPVAAAAQFWEKFS